MFNEYKLGIRTERIGKSMHLGIGLVWFTEVALVFGLLFWEVYVGKVYDMEYEYDEE